MSVVVKVDLTNPGQFFACCGLLELADRMWNGAEGCFEPPAGEFRLRAESPDVCYDDLLQSIASCAVTSTLSGEQRSRLKSLQNQKKTSRSPDAVLELQLLSKLRDKERLFLPKPFDLWLDWWNDDIAGGSMLKTWAGKQSTFDLVSGMHAGLCTKFWNSLMPADWLSTYIAGCELPFYFDSDLGRQSASVDRGFSLDTLGLRSSTRPMLEFAAFVGLQRFRPWAADRDTFRYAAWTEPLPPMLAAVTCSGALPGPEVRVFEFRLLRRNDYYKSFLAAKPIGA